MQSDENLVERTLTEHLQAVATKDVEALFNAFAPDALFVGTDNTEQWSREQLAEQLESSDAGWDMTECFERNIHIIGRTAMFFEVVFHKKYGPFRGSGTVIKGDDDIWRIAQYVLSFQVPNEVIGTTNFLELLKV